MSAAENLPRALQLAQKTNQFNATVTRYSDEELSCMVSSSGWRVYLFDVSDKFAKHGICAMVTVRMGERPAVDNFIMSCRVMGRNIEYGILSAVESELAAEGCTELEAAFRKSPKNMPVETLFDSAGYTQTDRDGDSKRYLKKINQNNTESRFIGTVSI